MVVGRRVAQDQANGVGYEGFGWVRHCFRGLRWPPEHKGDAFAPCAGVNPDVRVRHQHVRHMFEVMRVVGAIWGWGS